MYIRIYIYDCKRMKPYMGPGPGPGAAGVGLGGLGVGCGPHVRTCPVASIYIYILYMRFKIYHYIGLFNLITLPDCLPVTPSFPSCYLPGLRCFCFPAPFWFFPLPDVRGNRFPEISDSRLPYQSGHFLNKLLQKLCQTGPWQPPAQIREAVSHPVSPRVDFPVSLPDCLPVTSSFPSCYLPFLGVFKRVFPPMC